MSRRLLIVAVAGAVVVAGALAAALVLGTGGPDRPSAAKPTEVARVTRMLDGIPQQGVALGRSDAPTTIVEFADPQCPYCALWAKQALPRIVSHSIRTGEARLVFNGMTFVGADSERALRAALAAGRQGRFWHVLELLYANQGAENAGWVTDSLLRSVGEAVPGLDVNRMLEESSLAAVTTQILGAASFAEKAGVNSTPTFAVGPTGGTLRVVDAESLDAALES